MVNWIKKNYKMLLFSTLGAIVLLSSIIIIIINTRKEITPKNITLSYEQNLEQLFVGEENAFVVNYTVTPDDVEKKVEVLIVSSNPDVLSIDKSGSEGLTGAVTITPQAVSTDLVFVTFSIKGTSISKSISALVYSTPQPLTAPTDLIYNHTTNLISFTPVAGVVNYELQIKEVSFENQTINTFNLNSEFQNKNNNKYEVNVLDHLLLKDDVEYEISVKTKSNHFTNLDSLFSDEITIYKLSAPKALANNAETITWEHNLLFQENENNFIAYELSINNDVFIVNTNTYSYNFSSSGNYEISVKTINLQKEELPTIYDSKNKTILNISKLQHVQNLTINNNVMLQNGQHDYSHLTWLVAENSEGYKVTITPSLLESQPIVIINEGKDNNKIIIDEMFEAGIEYKVNIVALGNNKSVLHSNSSEVEFTKLETVSNLNINSSVLTYNVINAFTTVKYEVGLFTDNYSVSEILNSGSLNLSNLTTQSGAYSVFVRSLATHNVQSGKLFANSEKIMLETSVIKLKNPVVESVKNNSELTWDSVENAASYDVYYNNVKVENVLELNAVNGKLTLTLNNATNISEGENTVAVVAIGEGNVINSSLLDKTEFNFTKLNKPSQFNVINDVIGWNDILFATNYNVSFNSEPFTLIGTTPKYEVLNTSNSSNVFRVVAVGNNHNVINSEVSEYSASKLDSPAGLKVMDGVFYFNYNVNNFYKLFIGNDTTGLIVENGTYAFNNLPINTETIISVKAFPRADVEDNYYLSSNKTYGTVEKLTKPEELFSELINNNYIINWNEVIGVNYYIVNVVNESGVVEHSQKVNTNSYVLPNTLSAGVINISVKAMGNENLNLTESVVGYLNSNNSNIEVTKLTPPRNLSVENGILNWQAGINLNGVVPTKYEVYYEDSNELSRTFITTNTQLDFNNLGITDLISGNYTIKIKAVGNGTNIISSNYSENKNFEILSAPTNLTINKGVLNWNIVKPNGASVVYDIYLVNNNNVSSLIAENIETTNYNLGLDLVLNQSYGVYVVAKSDGYISSANSQILNIQKLEIVENFQINNSVFTWDFVENASYYKIMKLNGGVETQYALIDKTINFHNFTETVSQNYAFVIYALGDSENDYGYINSNVSEQLNVTVLSRVSNIRVEDGILKWNHSYSQYDSSNTPNYYEVSIYRNIQGSLTFVGTYEVPNNINYFEPEMLNGGSYRIEIVSVGNGSTKINSAATILGSFNKIDENMLNLRTQNGVITWNNVHASANPVYSVYLNNEFVLSTSNTSFVPTGLLTTETYNVKVVVSANGYVKSNPTQELTFKKLPVVSNFAVYKNSDSYFTWNLVLENGTEVAEGYEIKSLENISELNFEIEKGLTEQVFEYKVAGYYNLQIRAVGNSTNNQLAYINSDYSSAISLTVLDTVKNLRIENNQLKFDASELFINNQTKPDLFKIEVYDYLISQTTPIHSTVQSGELYSYDFEGISSGNYVVKVTSVGSENNKLNSDEAIIVNNAVLFAPSNLRGESGQITFSENKINNYDIKFEVYLNNTFALVLNNNSREQTLLINNHINNPNVAYSLKIRAVADGAIYSEFSEPITVSKLSNVSNAFISKDNNISKIYWTNVLNASSYRIYTGDVSAFEGLEFYNAENKYFSVLNSGANGFIIPNVMRAGNYLFNLRAIGNTTSAQDGLTIYLNSNISQQGVLFNVIENPTEVTIENGIINWQPVLGATKYLLNFYNTTEVLENTPIYDSREISQTSFDIDLPEFQSGTFTLRLYALGDGVNYLYNSHFSQLIINRLPALREYKVLNGYISWAITHEDIKNYALGGAEGNLTSNDLDLVVKILKGETANINSQLINNLSPLFNIEFTINGVKTIGNPFDAVISATQNKILLYYDVQLPPDTYTISARHTGNSTHAEIIDGQNLSISPNNYNEMPVINYSYGVSTSSIVAYKLDSPITPVNPSYITSIYDDVFYWTVVNTPSLTQVSNYIVLAEQVENRTSSIRHSVQVVSGLIGSVNINNIQDDNLKIKIPAGYPYYIGVIAQGTINSDNESGPYYLSSTNGNVSQVTILSELNQFKVVGGEVSFVYDSNAEKHILRIWNNPNYEFDVAYHNELNGQIAVEVEITTDTLNPLSPNYNSNLRLVSGIVYYNFENNHTFPYFSHTHYKASVQAVGNGSTLISSALNPNNYLNISKWNVVKLENSPHDITVENGMFKWKHVSFNYMGQNYYPTVYKVAIFKTVNLPGGDQTVVVDDILVPVTENSQFIYYELPDTDNFNSYLLQNGITYNYKYSIRVEAVGSTQSDSSLGISFVTGNSTFSKDAERLRTSTSVSTESGIVKWNLVTNASGYNLYISESSLEIDNGNRTEFEFTDLFNAGIYNVKVKAKSSLDGYLNSRYSNSIKTLKLENPKLRVDNGIVKWNNSSLPVAISTNVLFTITGPAEFNVNMLEQLTGEQFTENNGVFSTLVSANHVINTIQGLSLSGVPSGQYTVVIRFLGSTGAVQYGVENYYLLNSSSSVMDFTKLNKPSAALSSKVVQGNNVNIIKWQAVTGATNYNVIAIKRNQAGNIIKEAKFNLINQSDFFSYNSSTNTYDFNLFAVSEHDRLVPNIIKFDNNYEIYVEAYAENIDYNSTGNKYSLSDRSDVVFVEIPLTPTELNISQYGVVTWVNNSNTKPVLEVRYQNELGQYTNPELIEFELGVSSYKLTTISTNYIIRAQSIIGTINEIVQQSAFSEEVSSAFRLFASGDGSELNPYIISNTEHLYNINYYTHAHFKLNSNIITAGTTIANQWKPIGVERSDLFIEESIFTGVLDGNGYSINSLTYTTSLVSDLAFINVIGATGVVKNLTININAANMNVDRFGGVAIKNYGLIDNVVITGSVGVKQNRPEIFVAGVVVINESSGIINKTINNANLISDTISLSNQTTIGGLVHTNNGVVSQSGNNGNLTGTAIGGLVYSNTNQITESYNKGEISAVVLGAKGAAVGGLVARNETNGKISYSYVINNGNINFTNTSGASSYIGGLIGSNGSAESITNSYVVFKMGVNVGNSQIGMIAGQSNYSLSNYNKVYYLNNDSNYLPLGQGLPSVTGISPISEENMKLASFVNEINTAVKFKFNANYYPKLIWED